MVIVRKCKYCDLKMEESVPSGSLCCFCLTTYEDEALYGKFYKIDEITTHYFCLLLSSKIQQRGSDNEGIWGFLPQDIRDEVRRGKNKTCSFCGKRGATLSCHASRCKLHFHLPCGRARDTFHEFFGEFKSFCCRHRKSQRIKPEVLKAMSGKQSTCAICLESVPATPSPATLWAPCCSKDAWFHRICIQRLALSAGYFFKCPLCNNTTRFIESMRTYGIWIPEQDASWERDPERYEGLLQRHNSCDAKSCRCKDGRTHHVPDTKWEIKLCADCGSQGMHVHCGNLRLSQDWICSVCSNVSPTELHKTTGKISHSRQALLTRNRERRSLPARPSRVTRQRRPPEDEDGEEGEEERDKILHSIHSKSENLASKTDKGAPSTPQKDTMSVPVPVLVSPAQPRGSRPESKKTSPQNENSDVEILECSDDEIQILPSPNIRFIKTNSGLSVPVMKVHATQPSGEEVVAAGEPCQPTSLSDQGAPMDNDGENFELSECGPSTSQLPNQTLRTEDGVILETSRTVDEIILDDEPLQPSQSDDEIIVEYEQSNRAPLLKQLLVYPSHDTTSSGVHVTAEAVSKETTQVNTKETSHSNSHSTKEQNLNAEFLTCESVPSSQIEVSFERNGPTTVSTATETNVPVMTVTREQSSQTHLPKDVNKFAEATGRLTDMFNDLSKAVHSVSVATIESQQQQTGISSLQPEMFMPTANVFQSVSPLIPNLTMSTSSTIATASPDICMTVESNTDPHMSAWRSKVMNLVRGYPNDTQFTISPSTAPNGCGMPEVRPASISIGSEGMSVQSLGTHPPTSTPSLTFYSKTLGSDPARRHNRPFPVIKDYTNQPQSPNSQTEPSKMTSRQVHINLPNQAFQDDWSVEFGQVDVDCVGAQQSNPEEHPDVVTLERHSGLVSRGRIPWNENEGSSDSDEIIVVDDDDEIKSADETKSADDETKSASIKRKRKQKLVERHDYSQVRLFPPALMHLDPQSRQQQLGMLRRRFSTGACPLVCSGSLLHSQG